MGKVATEATLQAILDKTTAIEVYTGILANGWTVRDWRAVKKLVEDGLAVHEFPVGTSIEDTWKKNADTNVTAPWDVVHYDSSGNMYLKWHYALPDAVPFDAPEAIYYADENGLPAGTYNITIGSSYGNGWVQGQTMEFTLNNDMAEGDQLYIDCGANYNNNPANGRTWNVYAKGSTTSKDTGITSIGTGGTNLGTIGNVNPQKTNGQLNAISRVIYGSGRWSESAIRQYLNSTAAAGAWWTAKNGWDRPPSQAASIRGFLAGCDSSFLEILEEVPVVTALNTVEGFAETTETTMDKIFLPSLQEMYVQPQLDSVEGEDWDYFKDLAEDAGLTGKFQQGGTYPILITYQADNKTTSALIWLRSAYLSHANDAWIVYASGFVNSNYAHYARRGCPACKIKASA